MTSHSDPAAAPIKLRGVEHSPTAVCHQVLGYLGAVSSERLSAYQRHSLDRALTRMNAVIEWIERVQKREPRQSWPVGTKAWTGD